MKLKCKIMDADRNGASWSDEMVVQVEATAVSEPGQMAQVVNQATYELVTGTDDEACGRVVRSAGTTEHGICWVDDEDGCGVVIEWHAA